MTTVFIILPDTQPRKSNAEMPRIPLFCQESAIFGTVRKTVTKSLVEISAAKLVFFKIRKRGQPKNQRQNAGQLVCKTACWEKA